MKKLNLFVRFNLIYCLFIILWGAWVRLSGSGAGCGEHWPLCDGEVVPLAPDYEKLIEYTHRFTSGIFGITILWLTIWGARLKELAPAGKKYFYGALFFTITEALIGAVLVKKGLVADNTSIARAWVMGFHLVNTFFLVGCLVGADFFTRERINKASVKIQWPWIISIVLILFVGATGAIAALGDTFFPSETLIEGIRKDFARDSSLLIRLRIFHPIFAVAASALLLNLVLADYGKTKDDRHFIILIISALALGALNWLLMAPHWLVLIHLFTANLFWIMTLRQIFFRKYGEEYV